MSYTVAVVGGGYGGWVVAKTLDSEADADVVLIDPRDAFANVAGSLRALAQPDWASNMFFSFDTLLTRGKVVQDSAVSIDPGGVTLASGGRVDADYVVLATGSSYSYPARPRSLSTADALNDLNQTHKELLDSDRVLILGAGPVGTELAGEIKEVWPAKQVTIVDPGSELLSGFLPEVRGELHRQLDALGVQLRLGVELSAPPSTEPGRSETFTVTLVGGEEITADIWFRAYGVQVNSDYLADGKLVIRNPRGAVRVAPTLQVQGYDHVYALGDITDIPEAKMAAYAMQHAEIVAANIAAQLRGEKPESTYSPAPDPMILLPLGPRGGVGQMPTPDGPIAATAETVSQYKGANLFTERFAAAFGAD